LLGAFAVEIGPACPDLAAVLSAWPPLPEPLKAAIVAMVNLREKGNKRTIPEALLEDLRDGLSLNATRTTGPPGGDG
jgi:hypothetical protein